MKWFSLFLTESLDKQGTNGDIGLLWFVTNKQLQIERCLFLACVSHEAAVKTESTRTKRCVFNARVGRSDRKKEYAFVQ
jgi:hypothetical protein